MRQSRTSGSVEGVLGNWHSYSNWQDSQDLMGRQIMLAHEPKTAQEPEADSLSCLSLLYSLESG